MTEADVTSRIRVGGLSKTMTNLLKTDGFSQRLETSIFHFLHQFAYVTDLDVHLMQIRFYAVLRSSVSYFIA